jgi:hypothetical protein
MNIEVIIGLWLSPRIRFVLSGRIAREPTRLIWSVLYFVVIIWERMRSYEYG